MAEQTLSLLDRYRDTVETRRAVRTHRTDEYGQDVLESVLAAANNAPSAANAQPWEFVVVRDEEYKQAFSRIYSDETKYKKRIDPTFPLAGNSREFVTTPATVLVVGDRRYGRWWPATSGGTRRKLFHQSLASSIMTLHLAGVTAGLGTTWVTTRGPTQGRLRDLLDLPEWYHIGSAAPLGYPDLDQVPMVKSRIPASEKLHREALDQDRVPSYEDIMARKEGAREDVYRPDIGDIDPAERWQTDLSTAEFADLVRSWRPATNFEDDPIPDDLLMALVEIATWAPSGANAQPWEYVVIEQAESKDAVADAVREDRTYRRRIDPRYDLETPSPLVTVPPERFESAPAVLAIIGNRHLEKLWPQVPDGSREKLFRHSMTASIVAFQYAAAAADVGTTWYTPTPLGERRIRELIDAPPWYDVECVTSIGYPTAWDAREVRHSLAEKWHDDGIDPDRIPAVDEIDATAPGRN